MNFENGENFAIIFTWLEFFLCQITSKNAFATFQSLLKVYYQRRRRHIISNTSMRDEQQCQNINVIHFKFLSLLTYLRLFLLSFVGKVRFSIRENYSKTTTNTYIYI